MDKRKRPIFIATLENGCMVCVSHKQNPDGYIRLGGYHGKGRKPIMLHRLIYSGLHGEIPEGHEIDHTCRVRQCCNPAHLEALPGREHTVKGNVLRYQARMQQAHAYWRVNRCTGTYLGERFGVTFSAACRWIREWKKEQTG